MGLVLGVLILLEALASRTVEALKWTTILS